MAKEVFSMNFDGRPLSVEIGELAKQADGAVLVRYGDTVVISTACASNVAKDTDFFPLTVSFEEKLYSVGKIPGGFLRREGRPSEHATLTARMIDRPIRPLFAEGFRNEVQVVNTVLSVDQDYSAEMAAIKQLIDQLNSDEMKEKWSLFLQQIANAQPEELKGIIADMAQQIIAKVMMELQAMAAEIGERIDVKGIEMYKYINDAVVNNQWGFDLLRTSDGGESFEVITRTGFDDKYNYGCPSFLSTEEGLYFGTCNPFYGGQLYLLSDKNEDKPSGIAEVKSQKNGNSSDYYTLSGQVLKGTPTRPGVYIKDGRKVVIGY